MILDAQGMDFQELNRKVRESAEPEIMIEHCLGQRYIADGSRNQKITVHGTPGNGLAAYLDGSEVIVRGNAQDALGDTMNAGEITVFGSAGDAAGYAMRGGKIFIHGNTGYRAGIHMKAYQEKVPVMVVGGTAGSFLGEYQAGGIIVVLGLHAEEIPVGPFCGTGMHGGKIFIRSSTPPKGLPKQVLARSAPKAEMTEIMPLLEDFCGRFGESISQVLAKRFYLLTPDTDNPYHQLYTAN